LPNGGRRQPLRAFAMTMHHPNDLPTFSTGTEAGPGPLPDIGRPRSKDTVRLVVSPGSGGRSGKDTLPLIRASAKTLPSLPADALLSKELVLLVSHLEQVRAQLARLQEQAQPVAALPLFAQMLEELEAFADKRLDDDLAPEVRHEAAELLTFIQEKQTEFAPSALTRVLSLFRGGSQPAERREAFADIGKRLLRSTEDFFELFKGRLRTQAAAGEWHQTAGLFLVELGIVVDKLAPNR